MSRAINATDQNSERPIPDLQTLKRRSDFLAIRGGVRAAAPGFLIEAKPRPSAPSSKPPAKDTCRDSATAQTDALTPDEVDLVMASARFGLTVTKKLGNAVRRNRIRRRLRAAITATAGVHAVPGFDYVIIARNPAFDLPFSQLAGDLRDCLNRISKQAHRVNTARKNRDMPSASMKNRQP